MALVYPILYLMNHCDYKYSGKLLTFGEQEILLTDDQINFFFNASFLKNNTPYKSKSILKNIGFDDVHSLEYPGYGNPNIEMDLNYPLDKKYYGSYDCILDAGHMEHCFNLSEIMKTMFNLVKNDGIIIHYNPCQGNMNHGFYNFQPTFYFSFYKYCGFKDIKVFLIEEQYSDNKSRYRVTPIFENYNNMQYYSLEKSSKHNVVCGKRQEFQI